MFTRMPTAAIAVTAIAAAAALSGPVTTVSGQDLNHVACAVDSVVYKTPERGRTVWIPTNQFGSWQQGGSQGRTYSQGESTATGKGSSHTVGGSGGVDIKLVSVSGKYDYTWSRNTTNTVSWTESYNFSMNLPDGYTSRTRLYRKGYKFPVKQIVTYTNGCSNRVFWHKAVIPTKRSTMTNYKWAVELYKNRGNLKY